MAITAYDHHPSLRHEERDAVGTELQTVLVDLCDLALTGKQLHWNVVGPHFHPLHLQLDGLVDSAHELSDQVAERARALAWSPDGRTQTVAATSSLPAPPAGEIPDRDVVELVVALLVQAVATTRHAMDQVAQYDSVTEDLLHSVAAALEEHLWMFSAQLAR